MKVCTKCGEAKPLDAFYRNGKGGLASRCKDCASSDYAIWRAKNPEKERKKRAKWGAENPEKVRDFRAKWYVENRKKVREKHAEYRSKNPEKGQERNAAYYAENQEKVKKNVAKWRAENPEKVRENSASRRASKLQRTPLWAEHDKIAAVYEHAAGIAALGVDVHVDHIVPLRCKIASGLHNHWNLRVLIGTENLRKGNRLPPDPYAIIPTYFEMKGKQ